MGDLTRFRISLGLFVAGLVVSGLTAFPLLAELSVLVRILGIPLYWRLIDCSFGVLGAVPLLYCIRLSRRIEDVSRGAVA
jgi:hypothetical protein